MTCHNKGDKMFIKSLDENLPEGGNNYHDMIAQWDYIDPRGKKPLPLRTAWHMHERDVAPPRKPVHMFFLDDRETGETLTKVTTVEALPDAIAALVAEGLNPVVRSHIINDKTLELEGQERRLSRQLGTYQQ